MGRKRRVWIPEYFYHVGMRGNHRYPIFLTDNDFYAFFHILNQLHEKFPLEIASYCLMTNHYHLLIRTQEASLSYVMCLLNKRYANYYNSNYNVNGPVYDKRFFDKAIIDPQGMLDVSRYIHLNPVKAKMVQDPEQYPWSSYGLFKSSNIIPPSYMNTKILLNYFDGSNNRKREKYVEMVNENREKSHH